MIFQKRDMFCNQCHIVTELLVYLGQKYLQNQSYPAFLLYGSKLLFVVACYMEQVENCIIMKANERKALSLILAIQILHTLALCAEKCINHISKSDHTFPHIIQKYTNFTGLYFPHPTMFCNQIHNFSKFRMLFSAVLMNNPNSKICLKGEWSINALQGV